MKQTQLSQVVNLLISKRFITIGDIQRYSKDFNDGYGLICKAREWFAILVVEVFDEWSIKLRTTDKRHKQYYVMPNDKQRIRI